MVSCALNLDRRKLIALTLMVATLPFFGGSDACAEPAKPIGAAAWRLGDRLSLAAFLLARGGQDDAVERLLSSIKPIAEAMGIKIATFPPRAATSVDTYGEVIVYLVEGAGAETGRALAANFGKDAGLLYDVAIKSNLLLLLYEPGRRSRSRRRDPIAHERSESPRATLDRRGQGHRQQGLAERAQGRRLEDARGGGVPSRHSGQLGSRGNSALCAGGCVARSTRDC